MDKQDMHSLVRDIFLVFNATFPRPETVDLWAGMCSGVPLNALPFIRDNMSMLDSLPRNFGKAVLDFYRHWLAENTDPRQGAAGCRNCDKEVPGFFYAWRREENRPWSMHLLRCVCNGDPSLGEIPRMTKEHARRQGYAVMPGHFLGGPAGFANRLAQGRPAEQTS